MSAELPKTIHMPILMGDQVKYFGLISEMQSLRTLRTDHSMRCVFIWLGLATLYFGAHLLGNSDPRVVGFHRAIPWIGVILGLWFIRTDGFNFRRFRDVVLNGDEIGKAWGKTADAFSVQSIDFGLLGLTIIQWKLLVGTLAWVYIVANQYFNFHAHLVEWFMVVKPFLPFIN